MRGKAQLQIYCSKCSRITPAYAGKRQITVHCVCGSQDHPRLCGEKFQQRATLPALKGSPPPMRGKANDDVDPPERIRITPAYAGKSHRS